MIKQWQKGGGFSCLVSDSEICYNKEKREVKQMSVKAYLQVLRN